ncbi:hypothetical protein [Dyadobacter sp. Leaf189]|uniref:hypothetical protein n=1 Tax=Dyadobacter sp. Leaf189 TaxID=1736295 RepID=UPI0006F8A0A0|nr:hypothetical protein [Dyadobacter sp. Leaf189]KQS26596.1 hypothetical protein ASG33_18630 [Dyadobacter sp. Leaf189]
MKTKKLERTDEVVTILNRKLKIDAENPQTRKLEKQIRKIAKNLINDVSKVEENKIKKEQKLLTEELKRQKREMRIAAATKILTGKMSFAK